MLRIAAVGNTFSEVKSFVEYKFKSEICNANYSKCIYELSNGDIVYLCFDEGYKVRYEAMQFDALIVTPNYKSLLDVIRYRCERR